MRVQFQILLFMVCLNLTVGMAIALATPGIEYVQPTSPSNPEDYEQHFNATEVASGWKSTPFSGIPIIGDIFSAFQFLVRNLQFLLDGFPMFLTWISDTYITTAEGALAFAVISNVLRAVYAILMFFFIIEFISGRPVSD